MYMHLKRSGGVAISVHPGETSHSVASYLDQLQLFIIIIIIIIIIIVVVVVVVVVVYCCGCICTCMIFYHDHILVTF